ncbi:hypothetical protein C1I97_16750 [Streptomyces sp. NTH33]|uniref:DUF4232 domain-containing protein n=1 Tax=Streptomyces sp. NTH33 TaxID=1735453 RepID=UPI000DA92354|nr:DUF4232 domain-containing protein [Streptomyces sp. NTH33]PZH08099.1 hypothetical protein C1I97_16750 [Streptomyces sp. NTH33]
MTHTSPSVHRAALLASAVAVLGLLTACGSGGGTSGAPRQVSGTAAPATGDTTAGGTVTGTTPGTDSATSSGATPPSSAATGSAHGTGGTRAAATSTRCHTSELKASVGRNDPGAGQENFPVVLTNTSGRTCTVRGYPGAAFVDAAGRQLGPEPKRSAGTPTTVTLRPGSSAWAGLTFSNPGVSGARTATPAALIVTPPDERDHLTVRWTAGQVPVGGNASSVFLTVLGPGTAP